MAGEDLQLVYDAWNRVVKLTDAASPAATRNAYTYDARGFRIGNTLLSGGQLDHYYTSGWQCIEDRSNGALESQYVWGLRYIDDLVQRQRDTNANGTLDETTYALTDTQFNVVALSDTSGNIVQRIAYEPYGQPTFLTASYGASTNTRNWRYLFQGLRRHYGLYDSRMRLYDLLTGRFMQRDPLGYPDGMNLYAAYHVMYAGVDPMGTELIRNRVYNAQNQTLRQIYNDLIGNHGYTLSWNSFIQQVKNWYGCNNKSMPSTSENICGLVKWITETCSALESTPRAPQPHGGNGSDSSSRPTISNPPIVVSPPVHPLNDKYEPCEDFTFLWSDYDISTLKLIWEGSIFRLKYDEMHNNTAVVNITDILNASTNVGATGGSAEVAGLSTDVDLSNGAFGGQVSGEAFTASGQLGYDPKKKTIGWGGTAALVESKKGGSVSILGYTMQIELRVRAGIAWKGEIGKNKCSIDKGFFGGSVEFSKTGETSSDIRYSNKRIRKIRP